MKKITLEHAKQWLVMLKYTMPCGFRCHAP